MADLKVQTATKLNISMQKLMENKFSSMPGEKKQSRMQISPRKSFSFQRSEVTSHANKLYNKRRYSFTGGYDGKSCPIPFKRRNNKGFITPPTKFLLGGNINDPLNLGSLADEEINKSLNEVTPYSSPLPTPKHRTQVEVLIPPNINDPLNLNAGEDAELTLVSPKSKRRKYRKRKKHGSGEIQQQGEGGNAAEKSGDEKKPEEEEEIPDSNNAVVASKSNSNEDTSMSGSSSSHSSKPKRNESKIVSPVVPHQPGKRKRSGTYSRSVSRETDAETGAKPESLKHSGFRKQTPKKHNANQETNKPKHFRKKDAAFQYGNYNRYYGYRNTDGTEDYRLKCMRRDWFYGKDVLDVGCNVGFVTLQVARDYKPRKIIGMDIDGQLIKAAKRNIRHYLTQDVAGSNKFPISLTLMYGPIAAATVEPPGAMPAFPNNIFFIQGNYVLETDEQLDSQRAEYDTILCLSLTKWVHLNWGDEGLKRLFKRMYAQLRPGGRMILEAQAWPSYNKKKKLTETTYDNYSQIQVRPEQFTEYLLSKEVGFSKCEVIDTPFNLSKGFRRPIQMFTKGDGTSPKAENSPRVKPGSSSHEGVRE